MCSAAARPPPATARAVEALNNGDINQIMVYHDGQYGYASLDAVAGQQYSVNPDIINLCRELSC